MRGQLLPAPVHDEVLSKPNPTVLGQTHHHSLNAQHNTPRPTTDHGEGGEHAPKLFIGHYEARWNTV
jgi:hypothetical protein